MKIIENIMTKKSDPIRSYEDFWNWFQKYAKTIFYMLHHNRAIIFYVGK